MNVEDSYEIALRRLRHLELGDAALDESPSRMRDLEELATLACDENERLTRELDGARVEIERLRMQVASLQEARAGAQSDDEALGLPRRRGAAWLVALMLVGAAAAAVFVLRPWQRPLPSIAATASSATSTPRVEPVAVPAPPTPTPTVAAPTLAAPTLAAPIAPKLAPTIPEVAPTIPKVAPTIPKVAPTIPKVATAAKTTKRHHAAKHHASKSAHHATGKHAAKPSVSHSDDPLGGVNL